MMTFSWFPSINPGLRRGPSRIPHQLPKAKGRGPKVAFVRCGLAVSWASRYQSPLELAKACDVPARRAWPTGIHHTCETGRLTGSVNYQRDPIEPAADDTVLLCCSRLKKDDALDM